MLAKIDFRRLVRYFRLVLGRFFACLRRLTFADWSAIFDWYLVEVRIPLVAGRAFPISFGRQRERGKCC